MQSLRDQQLTSSEAANKAKVIESNFVNPVTTSSRISHNLPALAVIPLVIAVWFLVHGFLNVALGADARDIVMFSRGVISLGLAFVAVVVAAVLTEARQ